VTVNDYGIAVLFVMALVALYGAGVALHAIKFMLGEAIKQNRRIDVIEQTLMSDPQTFGLWVRLKEQMDKTPIGCECVEVEGTP